VVLFDDGGTQGLALLDRIANRRALLVLDAVALGAEPGTVHVLRGWKHAGERASTAHESNVAELLQASTLLGECPEQVTVIGIEPKRIGTGIGVSDAVAKGVGEAVEAARKELGRAGAVHEWRPSSTPGKMLIQCSFMGYITVSIRCGKCAANFEADLEAASTGVGQGGFSVRCPQCRKRHHRLPAPAIRVRNRK
jgi:hydrogenase maturation protease